MELAIALITALPTIIAALTTAIVALVKLFKEKDNRGRWLTIMSIADAAMKAAEVSCQSGADKKTMAMDIIKASCKSQGIEVDDLVDQIAAYIDDSIAFVNSFKK